MHRARVLNSIENGDGNVQIGENTGNITIGYSVDQHEKALEKAVAEKAADLERAYGAERALLQSEMDTLKAKLADVENDHKKRLQELDEAKRLLTRYENQFSNEKREAAYRALDGGEATLAQALLKELAQQARKRREDAAVEEAEFEFELGKLAEAEVRWADAAEHYSSAARLAPSFVTFDKAIELLMLAGLPRDAYAMSAQKLKFARKQQDKDKLALSLNQRANAADALGYHLEAERNYREALRIESSTNGEENINYGIGLNNLGATLKEQGRFEEAEQCYLRALKIARAANPSTFEGLAMLLNNLAMLVQERGALDEADVYLEEAMKIARDTVGLEHPDYGMFLSHAGLLRDAKRQFIRAEKLHRQALEVHQRSLGKDHPSYGFDLNNLALSLHNQRRLVEAEELYREALRTLGPLLPEGHPSLERINANLAALLSEKP